MGLSHVEILVISQEHTLVLVKSVAAHKSAKYAD
jgi:hypothetical protein